MKKIYFILIAVIASYVFNQAYLKIGWLQFTGIVLAVLILGTLAIVYVYKFKNRKKDEGEKYAYAFPDPMAKFMKLVDQRTQYESALLSMFFMMIGMIIFTIYLLAFTDFSWWFKGMLAFNSFWGVILMFSFLITNYQQYINYMIIQEEITKSTEMMNNEINTERRLK